MKPTFRRIAAGFLLAGTAGVVIAEARARRSSARRPAEIGERPRILSLPAGAKLVDNPLDTLAEGDAVQVLPSQSPPPSGGRTAGASTPSQRGGAPGGAR